VIGFFGSNASFVKCQAVALFKSYFGGAFDEDAIRNNFVLIYELLDGIICLIFLHTFSVADKFSL
jgi:hypothetical protein